MRLVFMGTPDFAVPALRALIAAGHDIAAAYCQPPRPAGRGNKLTPSPVQQAAVAAGVAVRHPISLKDEGEQAAFAALGVDAAVVVAYGLLLPKAVLAAPRLGCFNLHASLLPRWRGAAPIHRALLAGDSETGIAVMGMEAGLDTGPIWLERRLPIGPRATVAELHDNLAALGAALIVEALPGIAAGTLHPRAQATEGVTYAKKIEKSEGHIDWTRPAAELDRLVRALGHSPGCWFGLGGERIKVLAAAPATGSGPPGTLLDRQITVACGDGALRLATVQRAGRAPVAAEAFLNGTQLAPGDRLA
jgi:methionyl-tRNA formyltransferase